MSKKDKVLQIRLTEDELSSINQRLKTFHKETGIKINKSELLRFFLSRSTDINFLYQSGFISYFDFMDASLFNKTKYKRVTKCKKSKYKRLS